MSGGKDEASNDIESGGEAIACPRCSETLDYSEQGHNWLCERCGILWSSKLWSHRMSHRQAEIEREMCEGIDELVDEMKKENDAMERDTRGPAIVSVGSVNTGLKFYGPFVSIEDAVAWLHDCNLTGATTVSLLETPPKANIRSPKYEPHTMESLLPLAGEWVHSRDDASQVIQFSKITLYDGVVLGGICRSYKRLADDWIWATGPHKGKPIAKEVG